MHVKLVSTRQMSGRKLALTTKGDIMAMVVIDGMVVTLAEAIKIRNEHARR